MPGDCFLFLLTVDTDVFGVIGLCDGSGFSIGVCDIVFGVGLSGVNVFGVVDLCDIGVFGVMGLCRIDVLGVVFVI